MVAQNIPSAEDCRRLAYDLVHIWDKKFENQGCSKWSKWSKTLMLTHLSIITIHLTLKSMFYGALYFSDDVTEKYLSDNQVELDVSEKGGTTINPAYFEKKIAGIFLVLMAIRFPLIVSAVLGVLVKRRYLMAPFIVFDCGMVLVAMSILGLVFSWRAWSSSYFLRYNPAFIGSVALLVWMYSEVLRRSEALDELERILFSNGHTNQDFGYKNQYGGETANESLLRETKCRQLTSDIQNMWDKNSRKYFLFCSSIHIRRAIWFAPLVQIITIIFAFLQTVFSFEEERLLRGMRQVFGGLEVNCYVLLAVILSVYCISIGLLLYGIIRKIRNFMLLYFFVSATCFFVALLFQLYFLFFHHDTEVFASKEAPVSTVAMYFVSLNIQLCVLMLVAMVVWRVMGYIIDEQYAEEIRSKLPENEHVFSGEAWY